MTSYMEGLTELKITALQVRVRIKDFQSTMPRQVKRTRT